jgi:dihydrofolate reductase
VADAKALADDLRGRAEGAAWLVGGTGVIADFLAAGAVDELRLFHIPVLLGSGRPLFTPQPGAGLKLVECRPYDNGVVGTTYRVTR